MDVVHKDLSGSNYFEVLIQSPCSHITLERTFIVIYRSIAVKHWPHALWELQIVHISICRSMVNVLMRSTVIIVDGWWSKGINLVELSRIHTPYG